MKTDIILTANDIDEQYITGKNVIVIDAFRATTVIAYALSNGAKSVRVFKEIDDTKKHAQDCENALLCGERQGLQIAGFDLGNSPLDYTKPKVDGKHIFMTTSNGSKAIYSCLTAKRLYTAAFVNAKAIVQKIESYNEDFIIVCAGTHGKFSLEDFLCAGMLLSEPELSHVKHSDIALTSLLLYKKYEHELINALKDTKHYRYLIEIGFEKDIKFCLEKNMLNVAPYLKDMEIIIS